MDDLKLRQSTNKNLINVLKFANICWPIPRTVLISSNRKYWEVSYVRRSFTNSSLFWYSNTSQISTSMFIHSPAAFEHITVYTTQHSTNVLNCTLVFPLTVAFHLFLMMAYAQAKTSNKTMISIIVAVLLVIKIDSNSVHSLPKPIFCWPLV